MHTHRHTRPESPFTARRRHIRTRPRHDKDLAPCAAVDLTGLLGSVFIEKIHQTDTQTNVTMRVIGNGRYEVLDLVLGEGSFGKVFLGNRFCCHNISGAGTTTTTTKEEVAIKVITKTALSKSMRHRLATELQLHAKVEHENIVKMHDVVDEGDTLYLVMEKLDSDMFDFVIDNGRLEEDEARRIFSQLCQALVSCHKLSIVHHDVKLENCMLKRERKCNESVLTLKLVDFGLSCASSPGQKLQTFSGTEAYCAAEILAGKPYDGMLIDAYSAGVFLYICLTGAYPFSEDLEVQHKEQSDLRYLAALPFPQSVSKEGQDLVLQLLQPFPEKRPRIEDILEHPFFLARPSPASSEREQTTAVESHDVPMQEEDEEFMCEDIPTCGFEPDEELGRCEWEWDEWNALSEEFALEAGVSWEDRLTPDCKSL